MSKNIRRAVSVVIALVMLLSASACTINIEVSLDEKAVEALQNSVTNTTPQVTPTPSEPAVSVVAPTEAPTAAPTTPSTPDSTPSQPDSSAPTTPDAASDMPTTPEEILKKYTEVLNQAKQVDKPGYLKVEYQVIPEEDINFGSIANRLVGIAEGFMTSEEKARSNATPNEPGTDLGGFPIYSNSAGCLLTDTSAIKSASCTDMGDGTYKIEIVLNDEIDPQPAEKDATTAPSNHGGMFSPMAKKDIDETLAGIPLLTVNSFTLTYNNCTATLVYNPSNNHITEFNQITHVRIEADIRLVMSISGSATLDNYMYISDLVYV